MSHDLRNQFNQSQLKVEHGHRLQLWSKPQVTDWIFRAIAGVFRASGYENIAYSLATPWRNRLPFVAGICMILHFGRGTRSEERNGLRSSQSLVA
jgi:hypothetical protein